MYKTVALALVCLLIFTGCARVDVYTFKKERVDQKIKGNLGDVHDTKGKNEGERNLKRTLIGVDIDLTDYDEEENAEEMKEDVAEAKKTDAAKTATSKTTTNVESSKSSGTNVEVKKTVTKTVKQTQSSETIIIDGKQATQPDNMDPAKKKVETIIVDQSAMKSGDDWIK